MQRRIDERTIITVEVNGMRFHGTESELKSFHAISVQAPPVESYWTRKAFDFLLLPFSACRRRFRNKQVTATTICSVMAAVPTVLFSLMLLSNKAPSAIGKEWWDEMDTTAQSLSVCVAAATLWAMVRLSEKQFPETALKLKTNLALMFASKQQFLKNTTLLLLALYSATAGAGMAYKSFLWWNMVASIFSALFQLLAVFSRRYPSLSQLLEDIRDQFKQDRRFQREVIKLLKLLKPEERAYLESIFTAPIITEEAAVRFLKAIQRRIDEANIFREKSCEEYAAEWIGKILVYGPSIYLGMTTFPINLQNGTDGVNVFSTLFNHPLDAYSGATRFGIGFIPGITAATFVTYSNKTCIEHFAAMGSTVKQRPAYFARQVLPIAGVAAVAAIANAVIAKTVIDAPNVIFLTSTSALTPAIVRSNGIACFAQFFNGFYSDIEKVHPRSGVAGLIHYLKNNKLPSEHMPVLQQVMSTSKKLCSPLQANSKFKLPVAPTLTPAEETDVLHIHHEGPQLAV